MTHLKSCYHHHGGVNVAFADDAEHHVYAYIGHPILIDSDYRGDAVAGKRGERFVYFGLEKNGQWIRRWKLRQYQLDSIFGESSVSAVPVHVLLGKDVTPKVSINHSYVL